MASKRSITGHCSRIQPLISHHPLAVASFWPEMANMWPITGHCSRIQPLISHHPLTVASNWPKFSYPNPSFSTPVGASIRSSILNRWPMPMRRRGHLRNGPCTSRTYTHSRPVLVRPLLGASTGTGTGVHRHAVLEACWAHYLERGSIRVSADLKLTHRGCGRNLGLPGGSPCIRTKTVSERLSST